METYKKYLQLFPDQTSALCRAALSGRLAHAYIVHSDDDTTREEFSLILAQIAACPTPQPDGSPCLHCSVCRQIKNKSYAEYFSLMPNSKSRQITIGDNEHDPDTMRWFQAQFHMSNTSCGLRKIGIINDAECLNHQAQNAFLKTLEEPPTNAIIILSTAKPLSLLPTIRSRCHTIRVITNICNYNFSGMQDVIQSLFRLQSSTAHHLAVGMEVADKLIAISGHLAEEAETTVMPKWQKRIEESEMTDTMPSEKKRIIKHVKERCEAAVSAEYIRLRGVFLSLIHTWFAQAYQIACGADISTLSNPELYHHIDIAKAHWNREDALSHLKKAEELLENLNWNVNEELAIREFCCSFTA